MTVFVFVGTVLGFGFSIGLWKLMDWSVRHGKRDPGREAQERFHLEHRYEWMRRQCLHIIEAEIEANEICPSYRGSAKSTESVLRSIKKRIEETHIEDWSGP